MSLPELDTALFLFINHSLKNGLLDVVMPFVTGNANVLFLPLVVWVVLKDRGKALLPIAAAALAVACADAGGNLLKELIGRQRPCNVLEGVNLLRACTPSYSMPSNHAINAFAFAGAFTFLRPGRVNTLFLAVGAMVGISRVYVGVHYPGDVLAGAVLGMAFAYASGKFCTVWLRVYRKKDYRSALLMLLGLISAFRVFYILTGPLDLIPDEAHYWEWSRRPDWSYYSKGPLIAWLIAAGTAVLGDTVLGVRIFAVVLSALSSVILYRLGRELYDEWTGFVSGMLVQSVPLFATYGVILSIDSPFIFFWIAALYLFHKALDESGTDAGRRGAWIGLGIAVGLGLLAKYTMAFFYLCGLLFMLVDREGRRHLRTPWPYAAAALSLMIFSPVIFWNASHDWITVRHTAGQANVAAGLSFSPRFFFEFLGSQAGIVTPLLFVMIFIALWRMRGERGGRMMISFSVPVVLFFLLKSIQGKVQANWALSGYAAGFVAFARYFAGSPSGKRRLLAGAAVALALVLTVVSHYPGVLRLPQRLDPTARLAGWQELGVEADRAVASLAAQGPVFIFSDSYQVASELAFYMKGHPKTFCVNLGRRMNQYDLWPGFEDLRGYNALFVRTDEQDMPEALGKAFGRWEKESVTLRTRQKRVMKFSIFKCYDFKGMAKRPPETF